VSNAEHGGSPVSQEIEKAKSEQRCACLSEAIHPEWRRLMKRFNNCGGMFQEDKNVGTEATKVIMAADTAVRRPLKL